MQNLVMRRIQMRGQANIAEGGQGIGGDSGDTIFLTATMVVMIEFQGVLKW
jgi:hypothetical protein